ncbi:MAG TPA: S1 RNA-binding domain-containing protein, partial [Synergistales bacterium]|nr:S1 RNA-binding domain-containing protein [Synergistales bacterium]
IDTERKRIGLGYKQLNDPWNGVEERYRPKQDVPVKVVRLADFGAFVQLEEGVEGLIHISQLSRQRVEKPGDVLQEGQEIVARILEVNPAERRIRLSLSAIEDEQERKHREEERKTRDEERRKRGPEPRKTHEPAYQPDDTSVTIGDVLRDILDS